MEDVNAWGGGGGGGGGSCYKLNSTWAHCGITRF